MTTLHSRWQPALTAALTLCLLTGCAAEELPAGVDGDLGNSWAAMDAPTPYEPKAGSCIATSDSSFTGIVTRLYDRVVDCAKSHKIQIAGVGSFGAEGATAAALATAYDQCDKMATAFLKEDWRNAKLKIVIARSKSSDAPDGARWWECDLIDEGEFNILSQTTTDLSTGIPADLRYGCQGTSEEGDDITDIYPIDCAQPHNAEYAGAMVFPVGTPFPQTQKQWDTIHDGCSKVVGSYVGLRASQVRIYSALMRDSDSWPSLRDVRCYLYLGDKKMSGSAKGTNGKGVPL